jgi:hypothetical protein
LITYFFAVRGAIAGSSLLHEGRAGLAKKEREGEEKKGKT